MKILPVLKKTLVSGLESKEVLNKILCFTQTVEYEPIDNEPVFKGVVRNDDFRISLVNLPPHNALPLVIGHVEDTPHGSIIFLTFRLFPSSNLYLWSSFSLCLFCSLVFYFLAHLPTAGITSILVGLANYIILIVNFHRKTEITLTKFQEILTDI